MEGPDGQGGAIESLPTERLGPAPATPAVRGETLAPGVLLADRYRIVGFVARGGMGEVYEAEDLALGARVAIKTIRPAVAGDPPTLARFRREIQVARAVTHPNVCRVFDLAHGEGPAGPLAFFTMELLRGETLDERLQRGPIGRAEAQRILADVIAGLNAAHAADIVHRDLKPANVMLLADGRAVITDFGLARPVGAPGGAPSIADGSGDTTIAGTPAYMAPEVIAGDPPGRASDLYALGVVMTELLTGARPTAGAKPRWRDRRWEAAARRCLATTPALRPSGAAEVLAAVRGRPARRAAALAITGLALAVALVLLAWPRAASGPAPDAIRAPTNAEAARAHADGVAKLRVLDGSGARTQLRAAAARAPGFAPTLAELSAAERLAGDPLAARTAAAEAVAAVAAAPDRWTRAERLLVEARRAEAADDWLGAADAWAALDGFAPDTLDYGIALAQARAAAGRLAEARATLEALRTRAGAGGDARVELVAAAIADREGDLAGQREAGTRAVAAAEAADAPTLAAHGHLAVGTAATYQGDAEAGAAALARAAAGFEAAGDDTGIAEVLRQRALGRWLAGDLPGARALAEEGLARARRAGDLRGEAAALGSLSVLHHNLGALDAALAHAEAALALYRRIDDTSHVPWAIQQLGNVHYLAGDAARAVDRWLEALGLARATGDRVRAAELVHNLGEASVALGDLAAARLYLDEARAAFDQLGDHRSLASTERVLGTLALARDDLTGAAGHAARCRDLREALDGNRLTGCDALLAEVALERGDAEEARAIARRGHTEANLDPAVALTLASVEATAGAARRDAGATRAALDRARAAYPTPPPEVVPTLTLIAGRAAIAAGDRAGARAAAARVRAGADAAGPAHRLALELGAGELERAAGDRGAPARLRALADAAADRGQIRIARRARAAAE